ncbi:unnamed protein product [Rotaria sordida]|uniref:Uncharacterized protein n=1 Tax=Rotaria sordida TaxID=392033 RepID=A0A814TWP6_9BILA|nr:unnamed protein product [Rotaria sordida]
MNPSNCSPLLVHKMFQSLLSNPTSDSSNMSHQRLSASTTTQTLTSPPAKNSIRYIENDQNGRREKYDGYRWRLVCTWNTYECTNIACSYQFCTKHNALRRNKELPKRKRKPLITHSSLPIMNQNNHKNVHDDDNDIEILEEYCKNPTTRRSMNSNIKAEASDFNVFSVDTLNDTDAFNTVKSEPRVSTSYPVATHNDIEYITSTTRANGLNVAELVSKNIPPLTEFEEEFIAIRLMEKFRTTCLMLDAQLFLHNEALAVVKKNYRLKMDTVAPEYFYDFLLRHPRVALHYSNWFLRCKPIPPTTGCPIDTKVWTLSMIVRGAMASDSMNDEYAE